jgi:hypothetical protein
MTRQEGMAMICDEAYEQYHEQLEDFWQRRRAKSRYFREAYVFGRLVHFASNEAGVLAAVDHVLPLYSQLPASQHPPFTVQFVVQSARVSPGSAPDDLMQRISYTGDAAWLMWQLGSWGQVHVDLASGRATAVITPELAQRPDLIAQCLLNTILLNFCIANGFAMLHASCLVRDSHTLLLMAPHNTGKSTTALHLLLAGYQLLSDSMVFVAPDDGRLVGFPVGKIKLRADMAPHFPQLQPLLESEVVRDETKYTLELRQFNRALVRETAVLPQQISLCLLARHDAPETLVTAVRPQQLHEAVMLNSLFYDTSEIWQRNLAQLQPFLEKAAVYQLTIGSNIKEMIKRVDKLMS